MKGIEFWRLCDELSVVQAALLVVNCDPAQYSSVEEWEVEDRPEGYEAVKTTIKTSIFAGKLQAKIKHRAEPAHFDYIVGEGAGELVPADNPDWNETYIEVKDLVDLLSGKGYRTGFFFTANDNLPAYLDERHSHYSSKMGAVFAVWNAMQDSPDLLNGRTVKQAMTIWLRKNAVRFGLHKDDGNPNEQAIEEIAKVANWDARGGAPKTDSLPQLVSSNPTPQPPPPIRKSKPPPDTLAGDEVPY